MNRGHLLGAQGDSLYAVLCAAGYNIAADDCQKGAAPFLNALFMRLREHSGLTSMARWAAKEVAKFGTEVGGQRRLAASVSLAWG